MNRFGKEMLQEDFIYKYNGYIPVPVLGQIDYLIVVILAAYKAVPMNNYSNVKTAEKYLQFGVDKCMSMGVGKHVKTHHLPDLEVDSCERKV